MLKFQHKQCENIVKFSRLYYDTTYEGLTWYLVEEKGGMMLDGKFMTNLEDLLLHKIETKQRFTPKEV